MVHGKTHPVHLHLSPRPAVTQPARRHTKPRPLSLGSAPPVPLDPPVEMDEDLTLAEVKLLKKFFDSGPKLLEGFRLIVEAYNGTPCSEKRLQTGVKRLLRDKVSSAFDNFDCRK